MADVHESHVEQIVSHHYGPESLELVYGYRDMGWSRLYARSFEKAPHWFGMAAALANRADPGDGKTLI